jgi:hypothetical protein
MGLQGFLLLDWVETDRPALLDLESVQLLRRVWEQQFEPAEPGELPDLREQRGRATEDRIESPYDPDARFRTRRSTQWTGYIVHLSESCDEDLPRIITHAIDILTLPLTEALAMVKWLLYQVQKGIWEIYDNLRFMLVLGGYVFPEPRDLAKNPWGLALLNTAHVHLTGGVGAAFNQFPRKQESHGNFGPAEHHLLYQGTLQEQDHAEPAPLPFHNAFPEVFISQGHPYSPSIEQLYDCVEPYGSSAKATHHIDQNTWHTAQLGSAMAFSARLMGQRLTDLPNFNLDGDRGYAWKTWRAEKPSSIETDNPVPVNYIDV